MLKNLLLYNKTKTLKNKVIILKKKFTQTNENQDQVKKQLKNIFNFFIFNFTLFNKRSTKYFNLLFFIDKKNFTFND